MYKSAKARHRKIQHMAENQYYNAEYPIHYRHRDIKYHSTHDIESISKHTAGKTERIQTDVTQDISEQTGNHVIGIPKA